MIELIGLFGSFLILVGFLANQTGKLSNENLLYDLLNSFGSFLLLLYSIYLKYIPFVLLNFVWFAFSFKDLVKILLQKNDKKKYKSK